LLDFDLLDRLGDGSSVVHRLDPRVKLLTTFAFVVTVVSFPKYSVAALLPLLLYPATLAVLGRLPLGYVAAKLVLVAPLVVLVGVANPLLDRTPVLHLGRVAISGGWISFSAIVVKALLTISTALVLIGVTSFRKLCAALQQLGVPRVLTTQLLLVYRYLFVLGEEARRLTRARSLRSFGRRGRQLAVHRQLVGRLLLRTLERAQRVHQAMLARGFDGTLHRPETWSLRWSDGVFVASWCSLFVLCRLVDLPRVLGSALMQVAL